MALDFEKLKVWCKRHYVSVQLSPHGRWRAAQGGKGAWLSEWVGGGRQRPEAAAIDPNLERRGSLGKQSTEDCARERKVGIQWRITKETVSAVSNEGRVHSTRRGRKQKSELKQNKRQTNHYSVYFSIHMCGKLMFTRHLTDSSHTPQTSPRQKMTPLSSS